MRVNNDSLAARIQSVTAAYSAGIAKRLSRREAESQRAAANTPVRSVRRDDSASFSSFVIRSRAEAQASASPVPAKTGVAAQNPPAPATQTVPSATPAGGAETVPQPTPTAPSATPAAAAETVPQRTEARIYGQSDLDAVKKAFGSKAGEERFDAAADIDGNGVVDFQDNTAIFTRWGSAPEGTTPGSTEPPATFGQAHLDAVKKSFGAKQGDANYDAAADADGNGVIDFRDTTHILTNWGQARSG